MTYPRQRQPSCPKTGNIREQPHRRPLGRGLRPGYQAAEHQHHAQPLAHRAPQEQLPPSRALDDEPADGGEDGVDDHVDAAEQEGDVVGLVDALFEEDGEVVDYCVASGWGVLRVSGVSVERERWIFG